MIALHYHKNLNDLRERELVEWNEDIISPESVATIDGMFAERVRRSRDRPAYKSYQRESGSWVEYSWGQMADQVARWRDAIAVESLDTGDRVAVLLRNCPEWVMFDQASLGLGLVVVPLYTDDRPDNQRIENLKPSYRRSRIAICGLSRA